MKKITKLFACIFAIAAVSCAETEQIAEPVRVQSVRRAFTAELSAPTKTDVTLGSTGKVSWTPGDEISVLDGSSNVRVVLSEGNISADGLRATFVADVALAEKYHAVYPYHEDNELEGDNIVCSGLSAVQDGTFGGGHVAVATYTQGESSFLFHNVASLLHFTLSDSNVSRVSFRSRDGEQLSGQLSVGGDGSASWCSEGHTVLNAVLDGSGDYWIGVPGQSLQRGFIMGFYKADGTLYGTASATNPLSLAPGKVLNLGSLDQRMRKESGKVVPFPYSEPFSASQGAFTISNKTLPSKLTYVWKFDSVYGMKASAYVNKKNYAAESWLLSPFIDLTSAESAVLSFSHAANKMAASPSVYFKVKASADGSNWVDLAVPGWPSGTDWTFVTSGKVPLNQFLGGKVQIAFVYTSTTSVCGTWEIKDVLVDLGYVPDYKPADLFYSRTEYGIYNCDTGIALKTYTRYVEQTSTGSHHFSVIDPNAMKYYTITGIPETVARGDRFKITLDDIYDAKRSGEYNVKAGKVDGHMVWLYDETGYGFIIKK